MDNAPDTYRYMLQIRIVYTPDKQQYTHWLSAGIMPVFPGDEETVLYHSRRFEKDHYNNHQLSINMHAGTHIDGPTHLTDSNIYLNELPLETFIGEGCLLDVSAEPTIHYKEEYEHIIQPHQIVFLYTGHSKHFGDAGILRTIPY